METLIQALKAINDVIWGPGMLILLIGTGLYLTVGVAFLYVPQHLFSVFHALEGPDLLGWRQGRADAVQCPDDGPRWDYRHGEHRRRGHGHPFGRPGRAVLDVVYRYGRHGDQIFRNPACRPLP